MDRYGRLIKRARAGERILIDGGTGSECIRRGVPELPNGWSGGAALSNPDIVRQIHADYVALGADLVVSNTFATGKNVLEDAGVAEDFEAYNHRAVELDTLFDLTSAHPLEKHVDRERVHVSGVRVDDPKMVVHPGHRRDELGFPHRVGVLGSVIGMDAGGSARVHLDQVNGEVRNGPLLAEIHAMSPSMQTGEVDQDLFGECRFPRVRGPRDEYGRTWTDGDVRIEVGVPCRDAAPYILATCAVNVQGEFGRAEDWNRG